MLQRERLVLSSLVVLLATTALLLTRGGAPEASLSRVLAASDDTPGGTQTNESADSPTIRADGERLIWGDGPRMRTWTIGTVDLAPLMTPILEGPTYAQARSRLREELVREEERLRAFIEDLARDAGGLDPQSERYRALYEEYVQLAEAYESFEQEAMRRTGALDAEQLEAVYRIVLAAVRRVAEREDLDFVYRRTDPDAPFEAEGPQAAMTAIRLRDTLHAPDGLDITPLVRAELGLDPAAE